MADSIRKQVIDSIVAAIGNSTGITTATDELKSWYDYLPHQFPVATVLDRDTEINRLQFKSTGQNDKEAVMDTLIRLYLQDNNDLLTAKRTNAIRDIQLTMENGSTSMDALIFDIKDETIETDEGIIDNYSMVDIVYKVTYFYNHLVP